MNRIQNPEFLTFFNGNCLRLTMEKLFPVMKRTKELMMGPTFHDYAYMARRCLWQ